MRCNLDCQSVIRVLPPDVLDAGPLPTVGPRPQWGPMAKPLPPDAPTNLLLKLDSIETMVDETSSEDVLHQAEAILQEVKNEVEAMFQDAHNTGFYINEYTTKINAIGDKLLAGLRRASEKQMEEADEKMQRRETKNEPSVPLGQGQYRESTPLRCG